MKEENNIITVQDADDKEVRIFGYGKYVGDEIPPKDTTGAFGLDLHKMGVKNPKIVLEDGSIVWGCQCWWANREKFEIGNRRIKIVPLPEGGK